MIINKRKRDHLNETLEISYEAVEAVIAAKRLGVTTDDNLNFKPQINNTCT